MENIIVIGGGLMGSSAAWQLSQYGEQVLLIEQQSSKYREGSSYGKSRISRSLGPKNDIFSFVQRKTVEETKKLLRYLNGINPSKKHKMSDVYTTSPVSYIYNKNNEIDVKKLKYKGQKTKFKKGTGDAAFRKLGITLPDDYIAVKEFRKHSGTLDPHALISKMQKGIKKHDNKILYNSKATKITRKLGYYEVKIINRKTGKKKVLQAKKVVISAGPYTVSLLKNLAPYFKKLIIPKKVALTFFKISKERYRTYTKQQKKIIKNAHPLFDQNDSMYFSMLDRIGKNGIPIFKMGGHLLRRNIPDLDAVWKEKSLKKEVKWGRKSFKKYLRMLEIPIRKKQIKYHEGFACVYSMSKTKIPYVTPILTKEGNVDSNVVVIGGMSGTGAKGCLAYGLLAADLLLNIGNSDKEYQRAKKKMGVDRLKKEVRKKKKRRL